MQQNKYSQTIEKITTPPELKEKTRNLLIASTKNPKRNNIWSIGNIISIAAIFVLAVGLGILAMTGTGGGLLGGVLTGHIESVEIESIMPRDMELNFVSISKDAPPIRMANTYQLRQQMSIEDFPDALPENPPYGFAEPQGIVTAFFSEPTGEPDAILGEATYHNKPGAILTVTFTDTTMIYMPIEIEGSHITDTQLGVGYSETDARYYAAFEKNGLTYLITADRMDQQEFTQALIHFVT